MYRVLTALLVLLFFCSSYSIARQDSGGSGDGVKNTCEVSGGTFTGSESGNWACCWDDWGCYGCVSGVCKIKCHNDRCRRANGISKAGTNVAPVRGLAPAGMKPPFVPKKMIREPASNTVE